MFLAYIDESGDPGYNISKGSSRFYVISSLLVHEDMWYDVYKNAEIFVNDIASKRYSPKKFVEIHFGDFEHGKKGWNKQGLNDYIKDYIDLLNSLNVTLFSVVINKEEIKKPNSNKLPNKAIEILIERIVMFLQEIKEKCIFIADPRAEHLDSEWRQVVDDMITSGTFYVKNVKEHIVEKTVFVNSKHSFLIQLTDTLAGLVKRSIKYNNFSELKKIKKWRKNPSTNKVINSGLKIYP